MARTTSVIKDEELIKSVIEIKPEDITSTYVVELFGEFDGKRRCNPYDLITVPKGAYGIEGSKRGVNIKPFTTTVGKLIWNKMYILRNPDIFEAVGWVDDIVTKKAFNKLYKKLGYLLLEGKISKDSFKRFAMTTQLTMPYVQFLSPSFTDKMLLSGSVMTKKKEKLIKENKAAFDAVDIKTIDAVSNELIKESKEYLQNDECLDMFNSGGGGDYGNHYKNCYIMKGTVRKPDGTGYNVITSNQIDGVSEDEYAALANTLAEGPFNRSKKTEIGGYYEKQLLYSMQHLRILGPGTDCGTKRTIPIKVDDSNIDMLMYNFYMQNGKPIEITSENRDSLIGKTINLRFSSMCEEKNGCFCNICAGNLWNRLGISGSVGVITPILASKLKNLLMKSFHDSQVSLTDMNVAEVFGFEDV